MILISKKSDSNTHYIEKKVDMRPFMDKEPDRMSVNCNLKRTV